MPCRTIVFSLRPSQGGRAGLEGEDAVWEDCEPGKTKSHTHSALLPAPTGRRRISAREGGGMASVSGSSDFAKNCGGQHAMGEQAEGASHLRGRVRPTEFGLALSIPV